ncbi:MAG: gliding motility-associated C-terminal domain-containing protein [Saprospiraceae bacterium]
MTTGGNTSTATQLCEGTQLVNINDGCGLEAEFTIAAPVPITVATEITPVSCNGLSDGAITITPAGGTAPYDILWLETLSTANSINNLDAGNYTALITDDNNCTFTQTIVVNEPAVLTVNVDPNTSTSFVSCQGDSDGIISVIATGGNISPTAPYQFQWSNGVTGATNANLPAGTYTVTVTDFKNCTDDVSFTIAEPPALQFSLDPIEPPLCFGDPTFIAIDTVIGGAGNPFEEYTFQIDNNGLNFSVLQPATVFAGDHTVTVEDINGCTAETTVSIASPAQITIDFPESPLVVELGDSSVQILPTIVPSDNYTYSWTPADYLSSDTIRAPFVFPERNVNYTLTIVNENGCTATASIFVELDANRNVYIPNIFSPNGDGLNDEFRVFTCTGVREVRSARLFDRWGGLLYEATRLAPNCLNGIPLWDGNKSGKELLPGVYVYIIEVEFLDGVVLVYRGDVALIR